MSGNFSSSTSCAFTPTQHKRLLRRRAQRGSTLARVMLIELERMASAAMVRHQREINAADRADFLARQDQVA